MLVVAIAGIALIGGSNSRLRVETPATPAHGTTRPSPTTTATSTGRPTIPAPDFSRIRGDTWVLRLVADSDSSWRSIAGSSGSAKYPLQFAVEQDGTWFAAGPNNFSGTLNGVQVATLPERSSNAIGITVLDSKAATTPTRRLTNVDIINELIAPGSLVRTTVLAYATSVAVLGDDRIVDRPCWKTAIKFDQNGPGSKFGPDGWKWCVDKQTGILLSFEDQTGDTRQLTSVALNQRKASVPYPIVPAGTTIRVLDATGPSSHPLSPYQLSAAQPLDEVIADAKRQATAGP
jgi:hypothetical protein